MKWGRVVVMCDNDMKCWSDYYKMQINMKYYINISGKKALDV